MATTRTPTDAPVELCQNCDEQQPHRITVELIEESAKERNAKFSKEPYRVTECLHCGTSTRTRMNNA